MRFREIMDDEIKLITLDFTLPVCLLILYHRNSTNVIYTILLCVPVMQYRYITLPLSFIIPYYISLSQHRNVL